MEVINKLQSLSVENGNSLHTNRQVKTGSPSPAKIFFVIFVHLITRQNEKGIRLILSSAVHFRLNAVKSYAYRRFLEAWSRRGSFGVINWVTEKRQISKVRFLQVLLAKTSLWRRTAGKGSSTCVPVVIMEDSRLIARQSI